MSASPGSSAERDRLRALAAYSVLDTPAEPAFTALADSAAQLLGTSRAAITLLDASRQWSKATHGPALRETPRAWSLCAEVVRRGTPLVVADLRADAAHATNPLGVGPQAIRSYAGVPLIGRDGLALGALSVSDESTRAFTDADLATLAALAAASMALLEQRRDDLETGRAARPPAPLELDPSNFTAAGVRRALRRGEIEVHFQPVVSIPNGVVCDVEALARWNLPGVGLLPPQFFLPFVASSPLLSQSFTEHVLRHACQELAGWHAMGAGDLRVSVNVSEHDVAGGRLASMVNDAVRSAGVGFDSVSLELTQAAVLRAPELAARHLGQLRDLGVRISLDDFCVGDWTVEHATALPISGVKLNRAFVADLGGRTSERAGLDAFVGLCRRLGVEVVGVGVETQAVADTLAVVGVELAQGYYYCRPSAASALSELIGTQLAGLQRAPAAARSAQSNPQPTVGSLAVCG